MPPRKRTATPPVTPDKNPAEVKPSDSPPPSAAAPKDSTEPHTQANNNEGTFVAPAMPSAAPLTKTTFRKTRTCKLSDLSINTDDIRELMRATEDVVNNSPGYLFRKTFTIKDSRGTQYDSSSADIIAVGGVLDTSEIAEIKILYLGSSDQSDVSMYIAIDFGSFGTMHISVDSDNFIWTEGVMKQFEDLIQLWEARVARITDDALSLATAQRMDLMGETIDPSVSETRSLSLSNVVVTLDNIREIVKIMNESFAQVKVLSYPKRSFSVKAYDGSKYTSESGAIFGQGGILDTKQIKDIDISFHDYSSPQSPSIKVDILHGETSSYGLNNQISVSGNDSTWVNGVMKRFENAIADWEKQPSWPRQVRWPLALLFAYGIGRSLFLMILPVLYYIRDTFPPSSPSPNPSPSPFTFIMGQTLFTLVAAIPAAMLTEKFTDLWPDVELRMGREYAQVTRKRRNLVWLIMSFAVLPVLASILYDVLKSLY